RDIGQAIPAFTDQFGLVLDTEEHVESVSVRLAYLACRGESNPAYLQLVQPVGPGPVADFLANSGEGLHHVCFAVPDITQTLAVIGGEARTPVFTGGRGRKACFLAQRPGNILVE